MNTRYPPVPQVIGARPDFKYSAPWGACRIIHEHECMGTRMLVVGDPDNGGYEWVILISGKVADHSNDGYGISEVALRDGLIEAFKDCFTSPEAKPEMPQASSLQDSGQNSSTAGSHSPAHGSFQSKKDSSAHHGDACGDINCDGQCDDRAPLIILIDQCVSVDAARREVANATPAALRNAARYLRTDLHSLPSAITRRVRERLLKAA